MIDGAYARLDTMRDQARAIAADVLDLGRGGTHQSRFERDVRVEVTERRLAALRDADAGLVFGRIDTDGGDRLYIGRVAISDEHNEPLVVDWRAPAAEPFYRATSRHPLGLTRRRHFLVKGRRVVGIEDDLLAGDQTASSDLVLVGEAALLASLERARTGRMSDIVATIQREQDEVIRAPLPGILVVQGGPGTGKTAVVLHRAAYLLYTHRFPLERAGVLLIGPNRVFLRYIERVLPSLGEQAVTLATPATLLPAIGVTGTDTDEAARVKGDARMAGVVAKAVRQRERALPRPATIPFGLFELTLTPDDSRRMVDRLKRRRGRHNERRAAAERLVARHLTDQLRTRLSEGVADSEDDPVPDDVERRLRRERTFQAALERMWPILTPEVLLDDLFGTEPLLRLATRGVLSQGERAALARPRRRRGEEVEWTESDVALLDDAAVHLGPVPARARPAENAGEDVDFMVERVLEDVEGVDPTMRADLAGHLARWARQPDDGNGPGDLATRTFGHVLIDEAQDLTPMQLRMIGRRCPNGSMTVVGDLGQASRHHAPSRWDDVVAHLPHRRPPRTAQLTVNYRTPAEVMDLANRLLAVATPDLTPPRSVRVAGVQPQMTKVARETIVEGGAAAAREELAEVPDGRVAVIAPRSLAADLRRAVGVVEDGATVLDQPIAVYTVDESKGLEFDSVVVVEPAALTAEAANGLRALYVALTRTTRRLRLVYSLPTPLSVSD